MSQNPSWLNELIPAGPNKFYVVYPPMPAILLMPFRLIFGQLFEQQYLAHILGAGIVILTMYISFSVKKDKKLAVWAGLLAGFGTIIWFLSATGSVWYLSQVSAAFFLTAAVLESLNKKRPILIGILLGAAYLSRIEVILSIPFFLFLLWNKDWFTNWLKMAIGLSPFIGFDFFYNYLRFGVIWDKSYVLIPGVLNESWYRNGLFSPLNIPNHLKIIFLALPKIIPPFPYIEPSWAGLAIWITTPAFIYALFANIKEKVVRFSWLSILLISLLIFSHGTTGFSQFGYRFAVDFYPILIFLTIKGVAKTGLKWHHWVLLALSVLINLWGVIWINKFGWVGF